MRVGIVSASMTQLGIMTELLGPVIPNLTVYDQEAIDNGNLRQSNDHVLILDYSVDSIMEQEPVIDCLSRDEPKCILTEKNLYVLGSDERLAWRNKIIKAIKSAVPDVAAELEASAQPSNKHDVWVIGASSGGPDALTTFLAALPALPISLIIIQHIGSESGYKSLMSVLNSRQSQWQVEECSNGTALRPSAAYLVQRDIAVSIENNAFVTRTFQLPNQPSPSINASIRTLCRAGSNNVGAVILTGLGDDGSAALKEAKHKLIKVLAQASDDCAARSMPEAARAAGVVDDSATAAGLAKLIARHYGVGIY